MTRSERLIEAAGIDGVPLPLFHWMGSKEALVSTEPTDRRNLILHLEKICRAERQRGLAGHWAYDVARHTQILTLLDGERRQLAEIEAKEVV